MRVSILSLARALALLWAGFWVFFVAAEAWAFHTPPRLWLPWAGMLLLFVIVALAPWRWEMTGGFLLAGMGLLAGAAYVVWGPARLPVASRLLTTAMFAAPPLLAGLLFLIHHRRARAASARFRAA